MKSCYIKDDIPRLKREMSKNKIILLVYAPWCGHCKTFEPEWDKLVNKVNEIKNVEGYLSRVNIDNIGELGMDSLNSIQGVPSIVYLQNGEEKQQYNKERNFEELHKWVSNILKLKKHHNLMHNKTRKFPKGILKNRKVHPPRFMQKHKNKRNRNLGRITNDSILKNISTMVGGWIYKSKKKGTKVVKTRSAKSQRAKSQRSKSRKNK